jgi:hypothetical protein
LVLVRQAANLRIRRPFQSSDGVIRLIKNSGEIETSSADGFLEIGAVVPGDKVELHYKLHEYKTIEALPAGNFEFTWKGHSVVSASPEQEYGPLFSPGRLAREDFVETEMPLGEWSPLIPC